METFTLHAQSVSFHNLLKVRSYFTSLVLILSIAFYLPGVFHDIAYLPPFTAELQEHTLAPRAVIKY